MRESSVVFPDPDLKMICHSLMEERERAPFVPWRCHRSPCLIFQLMSSRTYHRNNEEKKEENLPDAYNTITILDADILEIENRLSSWR